MDALRIHGKPKSHAEFNCRRICKQRVVGSNPTVGSKVRIRSCPAQRLSGAGVPPEVPPIFKGPGRPAGRSGARKARPPIRFQGSRPPTFSGCLRFCSINSGSHFYDFSDRDISVNTKAKSHAWRPMPPPMRCWITSSRTTMMIALLPSTYTQAGMRLDPRGKSAICAVSVARGAPRRMSSAAATKVTPQTMAARLRARPKLDSTSGNTKDASPRSAGRRPATHAVSLQPSGCRLARMPTPMTVKLKAAMNP